MIQAATPFHAAAMAAIHAAAFPSADAWSQTVMDLQLALPMVFGLIAPAGGLILARLAADEAEILTLAVVPEQRRRGLGTALLREAMRRAAADGAVAMFLEVAVTNQAALPLYSAHGFLEAGVRPRYYSDGTDALVLRAALPGLSAFPQ